MGAATAVGDDRQAAAGGFDPAAGVFIAQDRRPAGLAAVDPAALTPLQRSLLVIDGTVTKFLEAWALEPVDVVRLDQQEQPLAMADEWLGLPAAAPVLRRRVVLLGHDSGRLFAWADSLIAAERISISMQRALQCEEGGLGKILLAAGAETRRECLWYGRESGDGAPEAVATLWRGDFLTRSYRVLAGGQPLMLITERFPLAVDTAPAAV